jgi:ankyrin repeat protein
MELGQAIHAAVVAGDVARCEALLARHRGCAGDAVAGPWLGAALSEAAGAGSTELVLVLLRARADVRFTGGSCGRRAIHHAVLSGHTDIIQHLLMTGSPINVVDAAGKTPMHHAVEGKQLDVVRYLLEKGASLRCRTYQEDETPLHVAARLGYTEICRALLTRAGNLNLKSRRDATALTLAVKEKHYTIVNLLCDAGANMEESNEKGQTPLLIAVELSSAEMCRKLLGYGANPNARDLRGRTCLHYLSMALASDGKLELVKLLIAAGMQNIQQEDVDRYTPLHYAAFRGHVALAELLIACGADVNKFYAWRLDTPLNMAISNRQLAMVRYLVERGVDVTQVDGPLSRVTALHKVMLTRCKSLPGSI